MFESFGNSPFTTKSPLLQGINTNRKRLLNNINFRHVLVLFVLSIQKQIRDRVGKFEKFIEENDAKRRRAIQKYQTELKLKNQKNRELDVLSTELEQLKAR